MRDFTIDSDKRIQLTNSNTGKSTIYVSGNFDGATVQLQYIDFGGNFVNLTDGLIEQNKEIPMDQGIGVDIYANVTGSGSSTLIYLKIARRH